MKNSLDLLIVMPAYNESECIQKVLNQWFSLAEQLLGRDRFQILVINDGSTDDTEAKIREFQQEHSEVELETQTNGGHGSALYNGYQKAIASQAKFIFQVDSDDQFSTEDFPKIWALRSESAVVLGHRKQRNDPVARLLINQIMKMVIFLRFGCWLLDPNVPYRLYSRTVLKDLYTRLPKSQFAPNIFLNILAKKKGTPLYFIPIEHRERETGEVSIVKWGLLKACFRSFVEVIFFTPLIQKTKGQRAK